jgi:peroxiredoxin
MTSLRFSQPAPEFSLPSTSGGNLGLENFKGKNDLVIVFYCYDWGGI